MKNDKLKVKCKTCNVITEKCLMLLESAPLCYSCHPKESVRNMTENQVAEERGVFRIWGVGNKRFILL